MSIALMPGTFDPPTLGHQDIILRAAHLCQKLIIGVAQNLQKKKMTFTIEERMALLQEITQGVTNIEVLSIEGLTVDFAKIHQIAFIVRGVRTCADLETEFQMAYANKKMGGLETLFLMADSQYGHISSSLIREIALGGYPLQDFVPACIQKQVAARLISQGA